MQKKCTRQAFLMSLPNNNPVPVHILNTVVCFQKALSLVFHGRNEK